MKINELRNRRMLIMEQISMREHSREHSRKSSAERRKKVEQSLTNFMKTMSDVPYIKTGGSEAFKFDQTNSQHNYYSQLSPEKNNEQVSPSKENLEESGLRNETKMEYDRVLRSPSFKDIKVEENEPENKKVDEEVKETNQELKKEVQEEQENIEDEEIVYKVEDKKEFMENPKELIENNSSASAIFFTSQFNEFLNRNNPHESQKQEDHPSEQPSSQIQEIEPGIEKHENKNITEQKYNQELPKVTFNESEPVEQSKILQQNKSNHSLAFSNESSLKYSLNESNIKQIINQKFTHELIAHTHQFEINDQSHLNNHFDLNNENSSLFVHLKFQILVDKFHQTTVKNTFKELLIFFKLLQFERKIMKNQKRLVFEAFLLNQELNLLDKKNEIKSEKFLQEKEELKFQKIFDALKEEFYIEPQQKMEKAVQFHEEKQNHTKEKIFRCFKIAWFDQKVKKEIDLYYLSKLFTHFKKVCKNEKESNRKKYLSFYCFNLKKRFFNSFKEGVNNFQLERIQRDNANCHYEFGLMRKVFDAWKDKLSYKDRYINLAMTTKNTFKETSDQRWMQIKTVDFRQIK